MPPTHLLLDIEGTLGPVSYVHEVLFPYAREHLPRWIDEHAATPEGRAALELLARDAGTASYADFTRGNADGGRARVIAFVNQLIDEDRKATGLKELQGLIWREGFLNGRLKAQVFDDAARMLRRLAADVDIRIYSSGSIGAQKLFFAHSEHGDLTPCLRGYYDTTSGGKREAESYRRIARDWGVEPARVLFVSDLVPELDAAREAGMRTLLSLRPGNQPAKPGHGHDVIENYDAL